jgi:hypothetical protein
MSNARLAGPNTDWPTVIVACFILYETYIANNCKVKSETKSLGVTRQPSPTQPQPTGKLQVQHFITDQFPCGFPFPDTKFMIALHKVGRQYSHVKWWVKNIAALPLLPNLDC